MPKNPQISAELHSSHMLVSNAQNSPSQASAIHEPWTSTCSSWFQKRQRNQRSNSQHVLDHRKRKNSRKASISGLLTIPKPLTVWITINCGKFWKSLDYQTTWPASWETCMQIRKQQLELDMAQQTGSKLAGRLSAVLSQNHLLGFERAQLEFHHLH